MIERINAVPCLTPNDEPGRTMVGHAIGERRVQLLHLFDDQPPMHIDFTLDAARQLHDLLGVQIAAIAREVQ